MGHGVQLQGGLQAPARKARAQQGQRVAAQCEAGGGVVEKNLFALGRGEQLQGRFVHGHIAQQGRCRVLRGRLPHLLAPVA